MNTKEQGLKSLENLAKIIYKCRITDGDKPLTGETYLVLINDLKIIKDLLNSIEDK